MITEMKVEVDGKKIGLLAQRPSAPDYSDVCKGCFFNDTNGVRPHCSLISFKASSEQKNACWRQNIIWVVK